MPEKADPFELVKGIAMVGLQGQTQNPGDYTDEEGLLVCGKCGKRKQSWVHIPDNNSQDRKILVRAKCLCEQRQEQLEKEQEEKRKAMLQVQRLREASLMDKRLEESTFDKFKVNGENSKNFRMCQRYATGFDEMVKKNQGLILWGGVGTGKSFAAACIANYLLKQGVPVVMTSFVRLLEIIQNGGDGVQRLLSRLNKAKLVIFDDLGAERGTDYALEKVYNIVDGRYRSMLPMILTTNLTITQMKEETDTRYSRIYDRLFQTCFPMQFTGDSFRKKEAARRYSEMEAFLNGE